MPGGGQGSPTRCATLAPIACDPCSLTGLCETVSLSELVRRPRTEKYRWQLTPIESGGEGEKLEFVDLPDKSLNRCLSVGSKVDSNSNRDKKRSECNKLELYIYCSN